MRDEPRRHLVLPILLIVAGVLLLLDQMGVWQVPWLTLARFWPALLVLIGLEMVLGRTRAGSIVVLVLVAGSVALGAAYWAPRLEAPSSAQSRHLSHPLGSLDKATILLQFAVGEVEVSALHATSESLYEADVRYDPARTELKAELTGSGDDTRASLRSTQMGIAWAPGLPVDHWEVSLSPRLPLRLEVQGGVGESHLDLTGLRLSRLEAKLGVGEATLVLSEIGPYQANIDCGVGQLTVLVPDGVEARLHVNTGLGAVNVGPRFRRDGDVYVTEGYEANADALEIDIDGGVGQLTVR